MVDGNVINKIYIHQVIPLKSDKFKNAADCSQQWNI